MGNAIVIQNLEQSTT
jgi:hypothetical protein